MPPMESKGCFMSYKIKSKILLIMISLTYGLLFVILLLGYFFPGNPAPNQMPWFAWAAIGEVIAMAVATITIYVIVQKKDKQLKEQQDNE